MNEVFRGGEMAARINAYDWSKTPLGAIANWSPSLKSLVKTLLASRYPMVLSWGADLIQFYNDAYSELIGDKHPAALGLDIRITLAEAWDTLGPMIETVMSTGVANWTPALLLVLERSGYREESYFSVSHAPAEDESGRIVGMLAVCSEVTQQVLGERRLRLLRDLASKAGETRSVEATCEDILEAIALHPLDVPFAQLYLRSSDGKNLTFYGAVGLGISSNDTRYLEQAEEETVLIEVNTAISGGPWNEPVRSAIAMPIASGQTSLGVLVLGISPNRALDEGYRSFYELLVGQVSVSLRNAQAHEEERRRAEALAELDRVKTMFFSNVSHEFRTPLTLMLGPVEEALADTEYPLAPQQRDRLEILHRNSLRLLKLVNNLLDFSRIEANRLQAVYEPTNLAHLTTELSSLFRSATERAGLTLTVDCPPLPELIYVDREMWEKIVLNLLSNAFKFTFEGGISISLQQAGDSVELVVQDTGTGIPAEELPRLFERFHRVQGAWGRTYEGSGIGLSLVQELVKLHGGSVVVASVLGQGSTFTVSIPTGSSHLAPEQIGVREIAPAAMGVNPYLEEALRWLPELEVEETRSRQPARIAQSPLSSARILLVDDNGDMREYIKRLLQADYQVEAVADGLTALTVARQRSPNLILSDIMMPGLDGLQLLQALRTDPQTREVPIVLLSARAGEEARVEGLERGADAYLTKPFSARELLAKVRSTLEIFELRKRAEQERTERIREQTAREEAEAANRMKDEFLLMLSHEIRTPLNGMLGWAQLLKQGRLNADMTQRALDAIERGAKAQSQLVDDLMDVSRIIRGELRLELRPVSLTSVIGTAVETVRPTAAQKGILIKTLLDPTASVLGDASRLQQVVWNLLTNGIKFTPQGGSIEVWLEVVGSIAQIKVIDTGVGIRADFLPYIFDRFRQADSTITRSQGGLGLGLAIVRHLVELQGGTVQAFSPGKGQGATFTVQLPLLAVTDPKEPMIANDSGVVALKGVQVLVVDDDADARELLTFILEQQGAQVKAAASANEALVALTQGKPQILVSDLGMPEEDGYSLIRRIRKLPGSEGGRIPAIALTAYAKAEDRRQALLSGFQTHIPKPVEPDELVVAIANLIQ